MTPGRAHHLARALLRLYPREWRDRYGDEWLAMVEHAGLSWRDAADVVGAAALERLRGYVTWRTRAIDPEIAERHRIANPLSGTVLLESLVFLGLAAAVFASLRAWVPFPTHWMVWYWMVGPWPLRYTELARTGATWLERVAISFYHFVESLVLTGTLWLAGRYLFALGLPRPSDAVALSLFGGLGLALVIVAFSGGFAAVTPRRWRLFKVIECAVVVIVAVLDDDRLSFWFLVLIMFSTARLPYEMSVAYRDRLRAAQAALQERMEREFPIKPGGYF